MRPRLNSQGLITLAVLLAVAFLVLLPVLFLVEESLNTGDPMAFPPEQYGLANYLAMFEEDLQVIINTVVIAVVATVMAVLIGFTLAWILTRTNVPGREKLERLMELPYYMTPLVGALAWAVLASPKSGFFNQIWRWSGGTGDLVNIYSMFGIAWIMRRGPGLRCRVIGAIRRIFCSPGSMRSCTIRPSSMPPRIFWVPISFAGPRIFSSRRQKVRASFPGIRTHSIGGSVGTTS